MDDYKRLKREHTKLFSQYHRWYARAYDNIRSKNICEYLSNKYISFREARDRNGQKRALYKELRVLKRKRRLAWCHYRKRVRFNIFRVAFFKHTKKCPEFCRQLVEQYL